MQRIKYMQRVSKWLINRLGNGSAIWRRYRWHTYILGLLRAGWHCNLFHVVVETTKDHLVYEESNFQHIQIVAIRDCR